MIITKDDNAAYDAIRPGWHFIRCNGDIVLNDQGRPMQFTDQAAAEVEMGMLQRRNEITKAMIFTTNRKERA